MSVLYRFPIVLYRFPIDFIGKAILPPLLGDVTFVIKHVSIYVWHFSSSPLVYLSVLAKIPCCLAYQAL